MNKIGGFSSPWWRWRCMTFSENQLVNKVANLETLEHQVVSATLQLWVPRRGRHSSKSSWVILVNSKEKSIAHLSCDYGNNRGSWWVPVRQPQEGAGALSRIGGGRRRLWIAVDAGVQSCWDEQAMPPQVKAPHGSCSCDGREGDVWQTGRCSPCWDSDAASICCGKEGPELEDSLLIEPHPDPNLCHRLWLVGGQPNMITNTSSLWGRVVR